MLTRIQGNMHSLMKGLDVASAAMQVQSDRMLVISQNIAHVGARAPSPQVEPYARKTISFRTVFDRQANVQKIQTARISRDPKPFPVVFSPGDPGADQNGYVRESNVDPLVEMEDLRETTRAHMANLKAYENMLTMIQERISLLRT